MFPIIYCVHVNIVYAVRAVAIQTQYKYPLSMCILH